jgi:hypothetical protein
VAYPFRPDDVHLILATTESELRLPIEAEDEVCLRFQHSIYGSMVEETFAACAGGLETRLLRYEEARLAEYYGHEHAVQRGEWWIVEPGRRSMASISLRVTPQSGMRLSVADVAFDLTKMVRAGGSIRVSIEQGGP